MNEDELNTYISDYITNNLSISIDVTDKSYTIELTGDSAKLDAFIEAIDQASILETVRTGASGVGRGERVLRV